MSEEKDSQSKKSTSLLTTIESGLLNLANNHIRAIQYSIYFIGLAGLTIIARRTHIFRKFRSSQEVPKDFITNCYRLQGKVLSLHPVPLTGAYKPYHVLQFQIEHIPICSIFSRKSSTLTVELAGVWPTADGINVIKNAVHNKAVWFKMYGHNENADVIYSSIQTKWSWRIWRQRDVAIMLLKLNQGLVASLPPRHLQFNKFYPDYYRKLLQLEVKYKKSG